MSEPTTGHCVFCNDGEGHDHPALTPEQFDQRLKELLGEEAKNNPSWWYMSFADEHEFLGGLYIKAKGPMHATLMSKSLGLNPGGEVLFLPCEDEWIDEHVPLDKRTRLLTAEEVGA